MRGFYAKAIQLSMPRSWETSAPDGIWERRYLTATLLYGAMRPSLSFNIAESGAHRGHSVAYFSLEMGNERIGEKAVSSAALTDSNRMRAGVMGRRSAGMKAWIYRES